MEFVYIASYGNNEESASMLFNEPVLRLTVRSANGGAAAAWIAPTDDDFAINSLESPVQRIYQQTNSPSMAAGMYGNGNGAAIANWISPPFNKQLWSHLSVQSLCNSGIYWHHARIYGYADNMVCDFVCRAVIIMDNMDSNACSSRRSLSPPPLRCTRSLISYSKLNYCYSISHIQHIYLHRNVSVLLNDQQSTQQ